MIVELSELLRRQTAAAGVLESRLRAVELVVAAEEERFVAIALDELETAAQELSTLEVARVLALSTAGLPIEASARELVSAVPDAETGAALGRTIDELRDAMERLDDARHRATAVVGRASRETRTRLEAASALVGV